MRRRTLVIAGGAAMTVAALGYRVWERGVIAGATGPAYDPWDEWRGTDSDGDQRPLRAAVLAASPHDTQPWLFSISPGEIAIYADRARHLGTFDPFRREMHLGLGCAIENFVCAARAFGIATDVQPANGRLELSPAPQPVLAARIALSKGQAKPDSLFQAIPKRHTNRGPYSDESPAHERLRELADLVSGPTVRVVLLADRGARGELADVIVNATEQIIGDPEMSMDSFRWIRTGRREVLTHRDGVTIDTFGISRLMTMAGKMLPNLDAATTDKLWLDMTRDVQTATAPVLGMIMVRDRFDMAQAIEAGRAWQRLHLMATVHGLAAQPLNQPVEMIDRNQMLGRTDGFGRALSKLSRMEGWEPTFTFRLGYAVHEAPRSPRRSVSEVVKYPRQFEDSSYHSGRAGNIRGCA